MQHRSVASTRSRRSESSSRVAARDTVALLPSSSRTRRAAVGFDARVLLRISAMAFAHRGRMLLAILSTALAAASQIAIPMLIGASVDQARAILSSHAAGGVEQVAARAALEHTALLLLGTAVLRGVFTMLQNYQGEAVGHLVAHELRMAFYTKLQRLSFSYHDRQHSGELMTRGILDIEGTRLWVHTGILRMVLLTVLIGGGVALLASVDPALCAVALAFVPVVAVSATRSRLRLRSLWYALQQQLGVLTQVMEENLGGIRVVRSFASHAFEMARFDVVSSRALDLTHRRIATFVRSTTSMTLMFFLSMGMVLWLGGIKVGEGTITLGQLTAFLAFMTILQSPVRQIAWMVNSVARASTCGARLFEILDLEPEIRDRPGAEQLAPGRGVLRFEDVCFSYASQGDAPAALQGVSFEARPGQTIGIVGPPGSGKSTIASLIPRFYDVSAGRITIDGQDIRDVTLDSLRRYVSVVQQDAFLFTSAIETNVAYADPWADRGAIRSAAETAQLHNYIAHLPAGYRTLVGERGVSLSGGQRQRLAIARGLLPESGIIVLDDSTAAIDADTERDIRDAIEPLTGNRVTIVIAHRLSSLRHADEILFLDGGRIVERGSHAGLIAAGGRYAALHDLQTRAQEGVA